MNSEYSKYWKREVDADLLLPDGHKMRLALDTRQPEWVTIHKSVSARFGEAGWDGVPESRLILMHDDWPEAEKRLRTARTWNQKTDFDAHHVNGLAWLIDQLGERQEELPSLLCAELVHAFGNMIEGIFSDCAFFLPKEESPEFPEYAAIYLEPALTWLLNCDEGGFEDIPMIEPQG